MSESDRPDLKQNVKNAEKAATSGRDANVDSNNNNDNKTYNFFSSNNFAGGANSWTTIIIFPIAILTAIFGTTFVTSKLTEKEDNSSEIMLQSVANNYSSPTPELLPTLTDYLKETEELPETKIDRTIERYNLIVRVTEKFQEALEDNQNVKNKFDSIEVAKETISEISTDAKTILQSEIHKHRISKLREQLKKQEFGEIVYLMPQELENQYTEGAIRTTYKILMTPYGFHADRNNDGFIDSESEADKIPCKSFAEIDRLWRDYTGDRCGWYEQSWYEKKGSQYDSQWISSNSSCDELAVTTTVQTGSGDIEYQSNITLLATIFPRNNWHFIKSKFTKKCLGLSPKN
ncbi:MAG: hypothetical protein ACFBSE_11515 [Prochloraceae cyanobacterium]